MGQQSQNQNDKKKKAGQIRAYRKHHTVNKKLSRLERIREKKFCTYALVNAGIA